jgi:hypothetical protein
MDPAAMGMPPGPPPGPPPTIEELAQAGDPLVLEILAMSQKMDVMLEALSQILDSTGAQVPAGQALEAEARAITSAPPQAAPKTSSAPEPEDYSSTLIDDFEDDIEEVVPEVVTTSDLDLEAPKMASLDLGSSLGVADNPGGGSSVRISTGFTNLSETSRQLADLWSGAKRG